MLEGEFKHATYDRLTRTATRRPSGWSGCRFQIPRTARFPKERPWSRSRFQDSWLADSSNHYYV
jgi:hypothetical protein